MALDLGTLTVKVGADIAELQRGLAASQRQVEGFGQKVAVAGAAMKAAFTGLAALGIGNELRKIVHAAGAANDAAALLRNTFGGLGEGAIRWADETADAMNRSRRELRELAGEFQAILAPIAGGASGAANFSKELAALTVDFAAFRNIADERAFEAIRSAILGRDMDLKRLGITLDDATLKAEALGLGFTEAFEKLSDGDKQLARTAALVKLLGVAKGSAAAAADEYGESTKRLSAALENLQVVAGEGLLPNLARGIAALTAGLKLLQEHANTIGRIMQFIPGGIVGGTILKGVLGRNEGLERVAVGTTAREKEEAQRLLDATNQQLKRLSEGSLRAMEQATASAAEASERLANAIDNEMTTALDAMAEATRKNTEWLEFLATLPDFVEEMAIKRAGETGRPLVTSNVSAGLVEVPGGVLQLPQSARSTAAGGIGGGVAQGLAGGLGGAGMLGTAVAVGGPAALAAAAAGIVAQSEGVQEVAGALNGILRDLAEAIGSVLAPLVPVIAALQDGLAPLFASLGAVLAAIVGPFAGIHEIVAKALVPVLNAAAWALGKLAEGLGWIPAKIFQLLDWLTEKLADAFASVGFKGTATWLRNLITPQEAADAWTAATTTVVLATEAISGMAAAAQETTERFEQIPWTKLTLERFRAIDPEANLPEFAHGGYVAGPTVAMIGEGGPEYIVPEDKMERLASSSGIWIENLMVMTDDPRKFVDKLERLQKQKGMRRFGGPAGIYPPHS